MMLLLLPTVFPDVLTDPNPNCGFCAISSDIQASFFLLPLLISGVTPPTNNKFLTFHRQRLIKERDGLGGQVVQVRSGTHQKV